MNYLLNGGWLHKYTRVTYVAVSNYNLRSTVTRPTCYPPDMLKKILPPVTTTDGLSSRLIKGRMRIKCGLQETQIRWCTQSPNARKDPVLYRDMDYPNFDNYRKPDFILTRYSECDKKDEKHGYAYVISCFGLITAMYATKSIVTIFVTSMAASADVLALSMVEVSLDDIPEGKTVTIKWRGKPLFVKHRTHAEINTERATAVATLRHQQTDDERVQRPEWLVVIGICTHLGCVPIADSGDYPGGFYCPCHGSHYDAAGRIRKGPAPLNLELPPYKFSDDSTLLIG